MKKIEVAGHEPSFLPQGCDWKLVWSDEFCGTELDETKWNYRLNFWGRRSPTFTNEGVVLDGNSHMEIQLIKKGEDFYSAHLQTGSLTFDIPKDSKGIWPFGKREPAKFMHRFGYYEIRCQLPKNQGWHAAFWLQAPSIGSAPDPKYCGVECDIMENYLQHRENTIICGCGYGGYGKDSVWPGHFRFPYEETPDGWHRYGVHWSKKGYTFYADGKEIGQQNAPEVPVSEVEQFILISTECHGYHRAFGEQNAAGFSDSSWGGPVKELTEAVLPDCFRVDYVRVFDEVPEE